MGSAHALSSSTLVDGADVYGSNGRRIGRIAHLLIDPGSGRVAYAVLTFAGALELGEEHYPIPWPALRFDETLGAYRTTIPAESVKAAPGYGEHRDWERRMHDHYMLPYYWS